MIIHVVKPGETLFSIADSYGISAERLLQDNELTDPNHLVVGQTIVIVYSKKIYIVSAGDTLESIAEKFGITQMQLLRNNPQISEGNYLYIGETLVIEYNVTKKGNLCTNGYAYPFIKKEVLRKTLPYLTYLTVCSYMITGTGNINPIDDREILEISKEYGVAPFMLLTSHSGLGSIDKGEVHNILASEQKRNEIINKVLDILQTKGYYGLNIDISYINSGDWEYFKILVSNLMKHLHEKGFKIIVTITPDTFGPDLGGNYENSYFEFLSQSADNILLLTYGWGYTIGTPMSVTPDTMKKLIKKLPLEKTTIGFPCVGYDWEIPLESGCTKALYLSYDAAIRLALEVGAVIQYDNLSQTAYYEYTTMDTKGTPIQHLVWFKDAKCGNDLLKLVSKYELSSVCVWNIMSYYSQIWMLINSQYEINRFEKT